MAKTDINSRQVRAWMVLQGLTQQKVAEEVGLCQQMVSLYLTGKSDSKRLTEYYVTKGCPRRHLPRTN